MFCINELRRGKSIARSLSLLLLAAPFFAFSAHAVDQSATQPGAVHRKARKKPLPPLVLPPLPAGPLKQVPMDQLPAAAPRVTYENGLLSIAAQNATLGDILREVHKLTGATIDIPPAGANDRVVVQLGPGAPREVMATLLNGTSFNYVMVGSPSDPSSVASVMLTSRPSAGGEVQTAVNNPPVSQAPTAFQQMQAPFMAGHQPPAFRGGPVPGAAQQPVAADDDSADDSDDDKDDDSDQPAQPGQVVQPNLQQSDNQDQGNQPNAGPKTPEQILQMIRDGQRPVPPGMQPPNQQPPQE